MTSTNDFEQTVIAHSLESLVSAMWYEIEHRDGENVDQLFEPDGVFRTGDLVESRGRTSIKRFFAYREGLHRTSRHLMANFAYDFAEYESSRCVQMLAVMTHFGAAGAPPLPTHVPLGVYDVSASFRLQDDGRWLIASFVNQPVFISADHPGFALPENIRN